MNFDLAISLHEQLAFLFQTDSLLSDEFYKTVRRSGHLEPQKRLMLAVLEDAIICFQKHIFARDRKGKRLHREAEEWILDCDNDWPFSFDTICEVLGFSPTYVRQGLFHWKRKALATSARVKLHAPLRRRYRRAVASAPTHVACWLLEAVAFVDFC